MLKVPQKLPAERVCGPMPVQQDWTKAGDLAAEAMQLATSGSYFRAGKALDRAYKSFADTLELEVQGATQTELVTPGRRGLQPKLEVVNTLEADARRPKLPCQESRDVARAFAWAASRAMQLYGQAADCWKVMTLQGEEEQGSGATPPGGQQAKGSACWPR